MNEWASLVTRARRGDTEAFDGIVRRFQHMAFGYAYSILRDFDLAEDAAQEAFTEAFVQLPSLREAAAFPAWLRKIVFKHCDRLTRGKRVPLVSLDEAEEAVAPNPGPHDLLEQSQTRERVLSDIRSLPEPERIVTTLYYINGYSVAEVGAFLDAPDSTVKNRLRSARRRLKERMLDMVEETLKQSAPGKGFSEKIKGRVDRLEWVQRWLTHLGCIEGCMCYLGYDLPAGWIAGGAGYAFALRIHKELCPAGIIAWNPPGELARNVGYETELIAPPDDDLAEMQRIVWSAAEGSLRNGMPCIGFACEAWQSYLIYGYDENGYYYKPVMQGDGYFPKAKMGVEVPCVVTLVRKVEPADARTTVREALRFAVNFSASPERAPGHGGPPRHFRSGLKGYDFWVESLEKGRADGHGMGFNAHAFAELRRLAVEFLSCASERLGRLAAAEFGEAIGHYRTVAGHLKAAADLFPMPADPTHSRDQERIGSACRSLLAARDAEKLGLRALERIIGAI